MGVLASIFHGSRVTLQPAGYYDDDEPPEGWESLSFASLFDLEDERTGGVGSIKVATSMLSHRKTASSSAVWRSATTPWPNISWKATT